MESEIRQSLRALAVSDGVGRVVAANMCYRWVDGMGGWVQLCLIAFEFNHQMIESVYLAYEFQMV